MNKIKPSVITIDGASGTGKGTISQLLASHLGWRYLDSGALYRVLALAAKRHGFSLENEIELDKARLEKLAAHLDVQFVTDKDNTYHIILEGEEVSQLIRSEEIGNAASIIAVVPGVRRALLSRQHDFLEFPGLVTDGRDMGTEVFPDADFKFFLTASAEERALRRYNQLKEQGYNVNLTNLVEKLRERDKRDQERVIAPLHPANDAICINTDHLSIQQVVEKILLEIDKKKAFSAVLYPINELRIGAAE